MHHYHKVKHILRRSLIAAALVLFFCDLLASIFPAFNLVWSKAAHLCIAFASLAAFLVEHFIQEEEDKEREKPAE